MPSRRRECDRTVAVEIFDFAPFAVFVFSWSSAYWILTSSWQLFGLKYSRAGGVAVVDWSVDGSVDRNIWFGHVYIFPYLFLLVLNYTCNPILKKWNQQKSCSFDWVPLERCPRRCRLDEETVRMMKELPSLPTEHTEEQPLIMKSSINKILNKDYYSRYTGKKW